ncbi:recombinase family protein [Paenibacillus sp. GYB004]|uniref:recombinase family protein n=1 Tax=Paenibacillus sp. GYB004 TaxID=2994393 RepID=UPI002F9640DF
MKAAIYIRVSTQEQAQEGFSVSAQKNRSISYCDSQGWEIFDFYIDEGLSAKDMERDDLKRMLDDAKRRKFDVIVVYKLDRLTRSVLDLYKILEELDKHHIKFKSVTEVYDTTTATGRLFITLVAALAQWERENLAERVYFGMAEMASQGKRPGGTVCYGYRIGETKKLEIDESQARIVRMIFDAYERNQSMRDIQNTVLKDIKPPKLHWSTTTINYMLRNPVYTGRIRWNLRKRGKGKTNAAMIMPGEHPPIISDEQFNRVQRILDKRRILPSAAATSDFIFSGILTCKKCGYSMSGTSRKYKSVRTKYYACVNRQKNFKCTQPYIREELMEDALVAYIQKYIDTLEKGDLTQLENNDASEDINGDLEKLEKLQKEVMKIQERKKKFQNMYIDELISRDDYIKRKEELDQEEQELISTINDISFEDNDGTDEVELINVLASIQNNFSTYTTDEKKTICQEYFKKIVVDEIGKGVNGTPILELHPEYN